MLFPRSAVPKYVLVDDNPSVHYAAGYRTIPSPQKHQYFSQAITTQCKFSRNTSHYGLYLYQEITKLTFSHHHLAIAILTDIMYRWGRIYREAYEA
jgi:hypothetical protein